MIIKQIVLSILLLGGLTNNYATAMKKERPTLPSNRFRYIKERLSYPSSTMLPYKENPILYEMNFRAVLRCRLDCFKCNGKPESYLQDYENGLLKYMQEQRRQIIENKIRELYYPKTKTLEWHS